MASLAYPQIQIAIRTLIALVFLSAAAGKLRHFAAFQGVLGNYRLLPQGLVAPVAHVLPPVEAAIAAGLLSGMAAPWPAEAAMILLCAFAVAMGANLLRGRRNIDCGCFQNAFRQHLSWILVLRNLILVLLLQVVIAPVIGAVDALSMIDGVLTGSVLFLVLQSLDILWSIVPAWRNARHKSAVNP